MILYDTNTALTRKSNTILMQFTAFLEWGQHINTVECHDILTFCYKLLFQIEKTKMETTRHLNPFCGKVHDYY